MSFLIDNKKNTIKIRKKIVYNMEPYCLGALFKTRTSCVMWRDLRYILYYCQPRKYQKHIIFAIVSLDNATIFLNGELYLG